MTSWRSNWIEGNPKIGTQPVNQLLDEKSLVAKVM